MAQDASIAMGIAKDLCDGFVAKDLAILARKDADTLVASYSNTFNGKELFHIRELYRKGDGRWNPGKGISVPLSTSEELVANLAAQILRETK